MNCEERGAETRALTVLDHDVYHVVPQTPRRHDSTLESFESTWGAGGAERSRGRAFCDAGSDMCD